MSKKLSPDIFFEDRGGAGPLAIYWKEGPYGNAVEANNGKGVGFFSDSGELIAVQFDEVQAHGDVQTLVFNGEISVQVEVKDSKVVKVNMTAAKLLRTKQLHPTAKKRTVA